MKHKIEALIENAIEHLQKTGELQLDTPPAIQVEHTRDAKHGDFACNIAMVLAKKVGMNPRQLANRIIEVLPSSNIVKETQIAGPGFINFYLSADAFSGVVSDILNAKENYGRSDVAKGKHIHVEFVSANPTGPLHVGHGRGAAYGAAVADLLEAVGCDVHREYYVNDAGRQMNILAASVWLRYLELCGETFAFPSNGYKGTYVIDIAKQLQHQFGDDLKHAATEVFADVPVDEPQGGDKEAHIDSLIEKAKHLLGDDAYRAVFDCGLHAILNDIKEDLEGFGVTFQAWFSERTLMDSGDIEKEVETLKSKGHTYEKNGALWFRATDFGDEKDRVLVRENGQSTYFASDVAYHLSKFQRGYDIALDVLGADHHGYVPRLKAMIQCFDIDPERLQALLVQFAILYRGKEKVQMSTRSGSFVTLRELREEVGKDAARYFYVMRKSEQHMDFDLELAKSKSNENPVYYIQYAHARICSVIRQMAEKNITWQQQVGDRNLEKLTESHELTLFKNLSRFDETIEAAALNYEPHLLATYMRQLANDFHTYYNAHQFLVNDDGLRNARLNLIMAVKQVIVNGLGLLGVSAPESM